MKRSLHLLLPAIAILLVFSCKKESGQVTTVNPGSGYASLDDIFAKTTSKVVTQSINVASGGWIRAANGARVIFPANAFQSYSGAIITGSVDVKVYDWLNKGDMIFARVLPISNNELMQTSGEALVEVTQNGIPVRLRKGYKMRIMFPQWPFISNLPVADSLWLGKKVFGSVNTVNWYARDTGGSVVQTAIDTIMLISDSLNYVSASHFVAVTSYNNFTVKVNAPVTLEQTLAVGVYSQWKRAVYPLSSAINNTIHAQRVPFITGDTVHVAVMGVNKGDFYGGIVSIPQHATDSSYNVDVKQVDPQTFRLKMNIL